MENILCELKTLRLGAITFIQQRLSERKCIAWEREGRIGRREDIVGQEKVSGLVGVRRRKVKKRQKSLV